MERERDGDSFLNDVEAQLPHLQAVKAEIEQKGRKTSTFVADVSNEDQVEKMVADVVSEFGELNVMVANAGVLVPKSIMEVSVAEWDRVQSINVRGVFLCYRAAGKIDSPSESKWKILGLGETTESRIDPPSDSKWKVSRSWERRQSPFESRTKGCFLVFETVGQSAESCTAKQMIKQGKGGKMVAACSTAGYRPTSGHSVAYSTSKWAVRGLTQSAALEFAKYDINVNAYCPGPVDTDMWKQIDASIAEREGLEPGVAFKRSIESRTALKRAQEPADIANLVSFLVSNKARNITGQSVLCDGGLDP
ncbi:hypothetical protein FOPE_10173 [Fonsecaea pedrosoi]|nr:hypothetical protein FOPE_10173 [Fonsecaea pedrosoi]